MTATDTVVAILLATIGAGTPLVFAALGELVAEKSGVLNLGVEGMMLVGAISGFIAAAATGSIVVAIICGVLAGAAMALIFAVLTLTFLANQVATGLALTIFGIGVSAFLGLEYTSVALDDLPGIYIPVLSDLPVVGPLLFSLDPLVYLSFVMFVAVSWFLYRSRAGLVLRGVGESPQSAHARGTVWGRNGRTGWCIPFHRLYPNVGRGDDSRAWLDSTRVGRVLDLAADSSADRRLSFRWGHHRPISHSGSRRRHRVAVSVDVAVSGNHRRLGRNITGCQHDPAQRTGVIGCGISPGYQLTTGGNDYVGIQSQSITIQPLPYVHGVDLGHG